MYDYAPQQGKGLIGFYQVRIFATLNIGIPGLVHLDLVQPSISFTNSSYQS
jgi:hypothetical protein